MMFHSFLYVYQRLPSILINFDGCFNGVFVPQAMAEEAPEDAVGGPEALDTPCEFSISHWTLMEV